MSRSIRTARPAAAAFALLALGCATVDGTMHPDAGALRDTNAKVHESLAEKALERGDWMEAVRSAREALRVDPRRSEAALLLSKGLLHSGRVLEAEEAAGVALELRPAWADALLQQADCRFEDGREAQARECLERASELGSGEAALLLGALHLADGDDAGGEMHLRRAAARGFERPALDLLASHLSLTDRSERAVRIVDEALEGAPADRRLHSLRTQLILQSGAAPATAPAAGPPAERPGSRTTSLEERLLAAAAWLRGGDAQRAAVAYRALVAERPESVELRVALGEALLAANDPDGAEGAFLAASRMQQDSRAARVGLARVELRRGQPGEAARLLGDALKIDPRHVATRSLLVMACAESGDLARARREAREVRSLAPGSELDLACRRLLERSGTKSAENQLGRP